MELKRQAAEHALRYVRSGMILGLGSGSTTTYFVQLLGERLKSGELGAIQGVPASRETAALAERLDIPLTSLAEQPRLDLAVDGADEVDPQLNLIKGLGRALLREKIIVVHSAEFVVIVDETKRVPRLGARGPLPVEILPFEWPAHLRWLNAQGCRAELWRERDDSPVVTDNGNYLARCWFESKSDRGAEAKLSGIPDPYALAQALANRPGILEHGLFLDMASRAVVATPEGIEVLERKSMAGEP